MDEQTLDTKYPRAVVAFAGSPDGYNGPVALCEADLLQAFVTELYSPLDWRPFANTVGRLVDKRVLARRFDNGIDSTRVVLSKRALMGFVLSRLLGQRFVSYKDRAIGRKARDIAWRTHSPLLCYSYYAYTAFKEGKKRPQSRFLFQVHPHPRSVRRILEEELERVPYAKVSLLAEPDLYYSGEAFHSLSMEPHLANGWVVASQFTARTLIENGISSDKIHVVPYGVNTTDFPKRETPPNAQQPFSVIFVGRMSQRKGISYLLEGVRRLKSRNIRVVLAGRGIVDKGLLNHFGDLDLDINVGLSRADLVRLIHSSDVFVLPSLVEGFGHVILENMACGLPVIVTPHTCGPDVIQDGEQGFIVPIRDSEAVAERLAWGMEHRSELFEMGQAAAEQARLFTWKRFRAGFREAYKEMVDSIAVTTG